MATLMDGSAADMLIKVALFVIVQGLVYLILKSSSDVFSRKQMRSLSFKPARSASIRRILAALSDMPAGSEVSLAEPRRGLQSPTLDQDKS